MTAGCDCLPNTRIHGAASLFHRLCCAQTFRPYTPPEGGPTSTDIAIAQPGMHTVPLNPGMDIDSHHLSTAMGEVMQSQSAHNLKLCKPNFDATGPA